MKFKISKIKNFVYCIFLLNKYQNRGIKALDDLEKRFKDFKVDNSRKKALSFMIGLPESVVFEIFQSDKIFQKIYETNYSQFEELFKEQEDMLVHRKELLEQVWNQFDKMKLQKMFNFFGKDIGFPETIYLFLGNLYKDGVGNYHYNYDYMTLFCRGLGDDDFVESDLKLIIHELSHFLDNKIDLEKKIPDKKKRKLFCEELARSFAPYGLFFENMERIRNKEFYEIVKNGINNGKNINDILPKLLSLIEKDS